MRAWGRGPSFLPVSSLVSSHGTLACCDHGIRRRSLWEWGQFAIAKLSWQAKFCNLIKSITNVIVASAKSQAEGRAPNHRIMRFPLPAHSLQIPCSGHGNCYASAKLEPQKSVHSGVYPTAGRCQISNCRELPGDEFARDCYAHHSVHRGTDLQ